jgi:ATP-dependent Lon protease
MYRINTTGYNKEEKTTIAKDYLLPIIREQVKFEEKDIIIPTETIQYIIEHYTDEENGVRNLKRCLEIIYTKLNLYRLMKPNTNLFEKEMSLTIEFPLTVTTDIVSKLIKKDSKETVPFGMYN